LLDLNPDKRPSANQCLQHPWLMIEWWILFVSWVITLKFSHQISRTLSSLSTPNSFLQILQQRWSWMSFWIPSSTC
jgi:serine/threonine protein kinase